MAGELIASRSVVVILGGRKPSVVERNSNIEDELGVMDVVLIPTCANKLLKEIKLKAIANAHFGLRSPVRHEQISCPMPWILVFIDIGFRGGYHLKQWFWMCSQVNSRK